MYIYIYTRKIKSTIATKSPTCNGNDRGQNQTDKKTRLGIPADHIASIQEYAHQ